MALTLDAGALIAIDRGDRRMHVLLAEAVRRRQVVTVPAPVIGQAWRDGARQARLARALAGCRTEPTHGGQARAAGELLARTGLSDVVDALVVLSAATRGDEIVTSDPDDLGTLASAVPGRIVITAV
ncbi:MAG: PIN domain-containing protein [Geodermatophilaceae bacterium]|nr:PIN domain-containing protein [Geodermatophilaceae bacterium]